MSSFDKYFLVDDNLKLIDFSEEDDNLIPLPLRDFVEDLRLSVTVDNANACASSQSVERRRWSLLRKSIDWDCALFTHEGLLTHEELCLINKGFKNDDFEQLSSATRKDGRPCRVSYVKSIGVSKNQNLKLKGSKAMPKTGILGHQKVHHPYKSSSSASSKSIKKKIAPVNTKSTTSKSHHLYESSFGASSKSTKAKIVTRNTKVTSPSSVLSPLSSPCSSTTSSASCFHNAKSATFFQTPSHTSSKSSEETKHATSSSVRKIESSGLRMPSRRLGFFDEVTNSCHKVRKVSRGELDERETDTSCSKLKTNDQIHKDKPKDRMNLQRKSPKGDTGLFHVINFNKKRDESDRCSLKKSANKNMCNMEDTVNGLNRHLEAIKLDNNMTKVKGQWSCTRNPFAEKLPASFDNVHAGHSIKPFGDADSHLQQESVEPKKLSLLRKSLDWDTTFFTSAGLLTPEELWMINEGVKKAEIDQ